MAREEEQVIKLLNKAGVNQLLTTVKKLDDQGRNIVLDAIKGSMTETRKQLLLVELNKYASAADQEIKNWLTNAISTTYVNSMNETVALAQIKLQQTGTVLYKWSGGVKGDVAGKLFNSQAPDVFNFGRNVVNYSKDSVSSSEFGDVLTTGLLPKKYKLMDVSQMLSPAERNLSPEEMLARAGIRAKQQGKTLLQVAKEKGYDGVAYQSNINEGKWVVMNQDFAKATLVRVIPKIPPITVELLKTSAPLAPHLAAVNALLSDAYLDFGNAMTSFVRGAERVLNDSIKRQIRVDLIAGRLDGADLRTIKNVVKETLGNKGFTVLKDRAGRDWTLDNYSKMLTKTHLMKANTEGAINRARDFDVDIVEISDHNTDCPICQPYEGNLYSVSGDSKEYDSLSGNEPPYHPNCGHTIMYRPDLSPENLFE